MAAAADDKAPARPGKTAPIKTAKVKTTYAAGGSTALAIWLINGFVPPHSAFHLSGDEGLFIGGLIVAFVSGLAGTLLRLVEDWLGETRGVAPRVETLEGEVRDLASLVRRLLEEKSS